MKLIHVALIVENSENTCFKMCYYFFKISYSKRNFL